jgi:hypothetical protein
MKKIMKICFVLFVLAMVLWGLDSLESQNHTNEKTLMIPRKDSVESILYWIPKDHVLTEGFIHSLLTSNLNNIDMIIHGIKIPGSGFELNFYGKKTTAVCISSQEITVLGMNGDGSECIVLNKYFLNEAYNFTKALLIQCSLEKEICTKDEFAEAIFIHELWHQHNNRIDINLQEYYVEYQVFESKAKNFYLTAKYFENMAHKQNLSPSKENGYEYVRAAYAKTFEIEKPSPEPQIMIPKFKSLIDKYGFEGLIQRYKDFK